MNKRFWLPALFLLVILLTVSGCGASQKPEQEASGRTEQAVSSEGSELPESLSENSQEEQTDDAEFLKEEEQTDDAEFLKEEELFRKEHSVLEQAGHYTVFETPLERDGLSVYGRLYLPNQQGSRHPLVIIGHGLQSGYVDCITDAESFADAGIAAYIFDFCGGAYDSESDGVFAEMSVLTEEADMEAVLDSLQGYSFFDSSKTFLLGESQGGLVAALLAAKRTDDIAGLILFYPAFNIPDNTRAWFGEESQIPEDPAEYDAPLGRRYYLDTINMDAYEETNRYPKDVLIVHGDADEVVPLSYSEKAVEEYKNAALHIIPGAGHGFFGDYLTEACGEAVEFVKSYLEQD